jgi:TolA-binding protein
MLNKHTVLTLALLSTSTAFANVPIESRGLSQNSSGSYNPSSASNSTANTSNTSWELIQQNQRLETQIRTLQGKLEEQEYQINQLTNELKNRYTDLDQRLELLQQKIDPVEADPSNETPTEPAPNSDPAINSTPTATQNASNLNSTNQEELDKAAYTVALDAYKQGGAKKAIAPMQNFVRNNPNSVYTGNAYFWLAEFNLAIEPPNYEEARKHYEIVASKFPNSGKASRSLYQLYSIAKDVNKNLQTAEIYKNKLLSTYPNSEEAGFFKTS